MAEVSWLDEHLAPDDPAVLDVRERVLGLIDDEAPLRDVLTFLCQALERLDPGALCSVLLVSDDGRTLAHGAAPSLDPEYCRAIDGIAIGDGMGSCGTAAATRETVIAEDIATDTNWRDFVDLAEVHRLASCHSTPVMDEDHRVLATFAIYRREPGAPSVRERQTARFFGHLVAVAIALDRV